MPEAFAAPLPAISVIVRSMDRASLAGALQSVAAQDIPGVELCVVTACGPSHRPLPDHAGAHPVRRVDLGRPLRRSAAANAGLDAAQAPQVIFLDDDDKFLPGHLARLSAALAEQPDAVLAYADVEFGHQTEAGWQARHVFGGRFDPLRLRFENHIPLHAALVDRRRGAAGRCRFDETLDLFEDWDWWLQLLRCGRFAYVPGVSAHYCAGADGGSGVFNDDPHAAQARRQLLLKWLALDSPELRLDLLQSLGEQYRSARQLHDELALSRRTEQDLRAMLTARNDEVSHLRAYLAARERETRDAAEQIDDLRRLVSAREQEIADGKVYVASLLEVMAARDVEIEQLRAALRRHEPGQH